MTLSECLQIAKQQLSAHVDEPKLEAEILLAHVLQKPRSYLHAWPEKEIPDNAAQQFHALIARRCQQEPVAYLTGHREFWSLDLMVTPDTLIPRPETELLIEAINYLFPAQLPHLSSRAASSTGPSDFIEPNENHWVPRLKLRGMTNGQAAWDDKTPVIKLADLGTGSGAIALALATEHPNWQIYATDISSAALQVAGTNAEHLKLTNVTFIQSDWCDALPAKDFDIIVSNPPYLSETEWPQYAAQLAFEPRAALVSGKDGLDAIRTITQAATTYLKPNGWLLIEHGFQQGKAVRDLFVLAGFNQITTLADSIGLERVTMGRGS